MADIIALAKDQALFVYFSNKALGMSMQYGLRASILNMRIRFEELLENKQLDSIPVYLRLLFIDTTGERLVDSGPLSGQVEPWIGHANLPQGSTVLRQFQSEAHSHMVFITPYVYKGETMGTILAEINHDHVFRHLVHEKIGYKKASIRLTANPHGYAQHTHADELQASSINELQAATSSSEIALYPEENIIARVPGTAFYLVAHDDGVVHYDYLTSNWFLFSLSLLALIVLASVAFVIRTRAYSVVLHGRYEESQRQGRLLEKLVEARTNDITLAKNEAEAARLVAERANHAKSEFLANMSHELRTPMHAILSFSEIGKHKVKLASTEKLSHYFSRINDSGKRLLLLLDDLLDLSKLEAGRMEFDFQIQDLQHVIDTELAEFQELFNNKALKIQINQHDIDTVCCFDQLKMLQVMRNLLSNAIKFTPEGKMIAIDISLTRLPSRQSDSQSQSIPALAFSISDEGLGIPEDELELVFDKFVQSSKTRTGAGGTGLGLAICKEIVEGHGGEIKASNNTKGGAVFSVTLPIAQH
jgi:signal transduction histidine kinase